METECHMEDNEGIIIGIVSTWGIATIDQETRGGGILSVGVWYCWVYARLFYNVENTVEEGLLNSDRENAVPVSGNLSVAISDFTQKCH